MAAVAAVAAVAAMAATEQKYKFRCIPSIPSRARILSLRFRERRALCVAGRE